MQTVKSCSARDILKQPCAFFVRKNRIFRTIFAILARKCVFCAKKRKIRTKSAIEKGQPVRGDPSIHYYDFKLPFLPEVLSEVLQVSVLSSEPVPLPQAEELQVPDKPA